MKSTRNDFIERRNSRKAVKFSQKVSWKISDMNFSSFIIETAKTMLKIFDQEEEFL